MNVFVLNTGRCGSSTFIQACRHITNYSAGHETRSTLIGPERLAYPANHIEADNRLSWLLGRLDGTYGSDAFYVHLTREREKVAGSFVRRADMGIMRAYREGILMGGHQGVSQRELAMDYIETVEANIVHFLNDKANKIRVRLETAEQDFTAFWNRIGAQGGLAQALQEWRIPYNASDLAGDPPRSPPRSSPARGGGQEGGKDP
jgi:hypothetical protein